MTSLIPRKDSYADRSRCKCMKYVTRHLEGNRNYEKYDACRRRPYRRPCWEVINIYKTHVKITIIRLKSTTVRKFHVDDHRRQQHEMSRRILDDRVIVCTPLLERNKIEPFLSRKTNGDEK
ncbi:hypothetical protein DICVIV_12009 [Dictyocaulus viviparus]|uniref:Uncharacterized protein n=1 Tax=Dictyocaulus viviparus TaxID=29172 RepID=A0A0D8XE15_DICVI|nr:hypothetical protein DICVIV_12009 [Dictyocaulus viviparus]